MDQTLALIILSLILNIECSFAQPEDMGFGNLLFELFDTTENVKFESLESVLQWSEKQLPFSVTQSEYLTIGKNRFLFCYVAGCSGLPCFKILCFREDRGLWHLAAKSYTQVFERNVSVYFDENSDKIIFKNSSTELGRIKTEYLSCEYHIAPKNHPEIFCNKDGNFYIVDIQDFVMYKYDKTSVSMSQNRITHYLTNEYGDIVETGKNDTVVFIWHKEISNNNIFVLFSNLSESLSGDKIVCERHICQKKQLLFTEIVEIDVATKIMSLLSVEGEQPSYCPSEDKYLLYQSGSAWEIFNTETGKTILRLYAEVAEWTE